MLSGHSSATASIGFTALSDPQPRLPQAGGDQATLRPSAAVRSAMRPPDPSARAAVLHALGHAGEALDQPILDYLGRYINEFGNCLETLTCLKYISMLLNVGS